MLTILLSSLLISATPNQPTEVYGAANTSDGGQKTITVEQPQNMQNPFGYIAPEETTTSQETPTPPPATTNSAPLQPPSGSPQNLPTAKLLANQLATVNPTDMNPLDYKDKIENTIYQAGDRLVIIQSIPIKYIKEATEPNIQPTINDFPSF